MEANVGESSPHIANIGRMVEVSVCQSFYRGLVLFLKAALFGIVPAADRLHLLHRQLGSEQSVLEALPRWLVLLCHTMGHLSSR